MKATRERLDAQHTWQGRIQDMGRPENLPNPGRKKKRQTDIPISTAVLKALRFKEMDELSQT